MRKFTLFLLLATSAVPAMAARGDGNSDHQSRRSSSSQSDSRPERAERSQSREQSQPQMRREQSVERQQGRQDNNARVEAMRQRFEASQQQQQVRQSDSSRSERLQQYRQRVESAQAAGSGNLTPRQRRIRSIPDTNPVVVQRSTSGRDGRYDSRRSGNYTRWSNNWRNDRRYDWRHYRDRNRSIFRIGFYYDPFGYSYRRYSLGSFLFSGYYQSNYWINDPWQYRLPPAYGPYRWVRYHNDALLVDTWTGEVVDVIYGFFW